MKKITIICVDYQSHIETNAYIKSIMAMSDKIDIILVCNSGDENFHHLNSYQQVSVFDFGDNLGYMEAANRGFEKYVIEKSMPDWVILSNTDIDFINSDFFERLASDERTESIIAPEIITLDHVKQNPFMVRRLSKLKLGFLRCIYSNSYTFSIYDLLSRYKIKSSRFLGSTANEVLSNSKVYSAHGSFIILGRGYFDKKCDLSHPCFLYGEELIISERANNANVDIIFDCSYKICHKEHVSTGKLASKIKAKYMKESLSYVYNKYYR